jgi:hypothetical protein
LERYQITVHVGIVQFHMDRTFDTLEQAEEFCVDMLNDGRRHPITIASRKDQVVTVVAARAITMCSITKTNL